MADYAELAAVAQELILEFGRPVSLRKVTTASAPDPSKPWVPGAEATADAVCVGVFLDTERSFLSGEEIPEDQSIVLVDAKTLGAVVPIGKDRVVDGADVWEVVTVLTLRPADVALLYELRVKR